MALSLSDAFNSMGIPDDIRRGYESTGLKSLFQWQVDCLNESGVLKGSQSLLYTAATGSGKSLIAELVIFKTAISLKKKAIFVLPYVALVTEKEKHIKRVLRLYNQSQGSERDKVTVRSVYGDKSIQKVCNHKCKIIICTIEKANSVVNILIAQQMVHTIGCIALDECHCIGNAFNGAVLETMISKLKFLAEKSAIDTSVRLTADALSAHSRHRLPQIKIQYVLLSATIGSLASLQRWLDCKVYSTSYRPVKLIEHIVSGRDIYSADGTLLDTLTCSSVGPKDILSALCCRALEKGQQILLFCPTKNDCRAVCHHLTQALNHHSTHRGGKLSPPVLQRHRTQLGADIAKDCASMGRSAVDSVLASGVLCGVAFHHSDLSDGVKKSVEEAFRRYALSILCCTTTVAVGVNLPSGCVIIKSLNIGREKLTVNQYRQMVGRAGRPGLTDALTADSFLLTTAPSASMKPMQISPPLALREGMSLVSGPNQEVKSQLHPERDSGNAMLKALIELFCNGACRTVSDCLQWLRRTLMYHEIDGDEGYLLRKDLEQLCKVSVQYLSDCKILDSKPLPPGSDLMGAGEAAMALAVPYSVSRFGRAIMQGSMAVVDATVIFDSLDRATKCMLLSHELHLMYLVTPLDHPIQPRFDLLHTWLEQHATADRMGKAQDCSSPGVLLSVIGFKSSDLPILQQWRMTPPSAHALSQCFSIIRKEILQSASLVDRSSSENVQEGALCRGLTSKTDTGSHDGLLHTMPHRHWQVLSYAKRMAAAMFMCNANANERGMCDQSLLETLRTDYRRMAGKVERLAHELGWLSLEAIVASFRQQHFEESDKAVLRLKREVPALTSAIARVLTAEGVLSRTDLCTVQPSRLADMVRLSKSYSANISLNDVRKVLGEDDSEEEEQRENPAFCDRVRDMQARNRLEVWFSNLITATLATIEAEEIALDGLQQSLVVGGLAEESEDGLMGEVHNDQEGAVDDFETSAASNSSLLMDVEDEDEDDSQPSQVSMECGEGGMFTQATQALLSRLESESEEDADDEEAFLSPRSPHESSSPSDLIDAESVWMNLATQPSSAARLVDGARTAATPCCYPQHLEVLELIHSPGPLCSSHANSASTRSLVDHHPLSPAPTHSPNGPIHMQNLSDCGTPSQPPPPAPEFSADALKGDQTAFCLRDTTGPNGPRLLALLLSRMVDRMRSAGPASGRVVGFELITKYVPLARRHLHGPEDGTSRYSLQELVDESWAGLAAWDDTTMRRHAQLCTSVQGSTKSIKKGKATQWSSWDQECSIKESMARAPTVCTGICLSFGDHTSYYLPLHTCLPEPLYLRRESPLGSTASAGPGGAQAALNTRLDSLPARILELVALFVGQPSAVNRRMCITSRLALQRQWEEAVSSAIVQLYELQRLAAPDSTAMHKLITFIPHRTLCWALVAILLECPSTTKCALSMKTKLVILRGRGLHIRGFLEDPQVAEDLLPSSWVGGSIPSPTRLEIPDTAHRGNGNRGEESSLHSVLEAAYISIAVLRSMAAQTLRLARDDLVDVFRNVEMQMVNLTSLLEWAGVGIACDFFEHLKEQMVGRMATIEEYFGVLLPEFNISRRQDVVKLRRKLASAHAHVIERNRVISEMSNGAHETSDIALNTALPSDLKISEWSANMIASPMSKDQAEAQVDRHPLLLLCGEYRQHQHTIAQCNSVIAATFRGSQNETCRRCQAIHSPRLPTGRVRARWAAIGSSTGRMIATSPSLQTIKQIAKLRCVSRKSLCEELLDLGLSHEETLRARDGHLALVADALSKRKEQVRVQIDADRGGIGSADLQTNVASAHLMWDCSYRGIVAGGDIRGILVEPAEVRLDSDVSKCTLCEKSISTASAADSRNVTRLDAPIIMDDAEMDFLTATLENTCPSFLLSPSHLPAPSVLSADRLELLRASEKSLSGSYLTVNPRHGIIARPGYSLVSADFAQVELRVMAHFSQDPELISAFSRRGDVFREIAACWKGREEASISAGERAAVKQLCYSIIYGSGAKRFAHEAGISLPTARKVMNGFLEFYAGIPAFIKLVREDARKRGYVTSLLGRKRITSLSTSSSKSDGDASKVPGRGNGARAREAREDRQAVNSVCQGSSADLIKIAIINVHARLVGLHGVELGEIHGARKTFRYSFGQRNERSTANGQEGHHDDSCDAYLVHCIHDEAVYEVRDCFLKDIAATIKSTMEMNMLSVPLVVSIKVGRSWGEMKEYLLPCK